jgi:hypothetical protein
MARIPLHAADMISVAHHAGCKTVARGELGMGPAGVEDAR